MIKPADPTKITLKDLVNSGHGDTVVSILIEFHKFWTYENREVMISDSTGTNTDENDRPLEEKLS
jgi:serine/threonine-protein phosphatase 2A regulatory subunit B''/actin-binding protein anillin